VSTVLVILSILLTIYWLVLLGRIILDLLLSLTGGRGLSGLAIIYGILYDLTNLSFDPSGDSFPLCASVLLPSICPPSWYSC